MKKELSNKITNVNFILTVLIVLMHSNCLSYANTNLSNYEFVRILEEIILTICDIAVPCFFCLSAYLFFRNFNISKYPSKIKSRIKSLVVPYLFWSSIFLIYTIIITNISWIKELNTILDPIQYDITSFIKYIILAKYDGPLWYIKILFLLCLISPILYYLINKLKKANLGIVCIIFLLNLYFEPSYYGFLYWFPLYYLIAYLTINKIDKNYPSGWWLYLLYIVLFILAVLFPLNYQVNYLYKMFLPFPLIILFLRFKFLEKEPKEITKHSFIIYCTHNAIAVAIKRIIILFIGNNPILMLFLQLITCILTLLFIYIVITLLIKIAPRFVQFISGGRTL